MLECVCGVSDDLDPIAGVRRLIGECRDQLGGRAPAAGLFFTSCIDADLARMLAEINAAFGDIELIGCTTDGEITPRLGYSEDSSALLLLVSDTIRFAASVASGLSEDPAASIAEAYRQARERLAEEPALAIVLPDGISTMGVPIDTLLRGAMGEALPIFGGSAGDCFRIVQTFQFHGTAVLTDAMPLLLLAGELELTHQIAVGPEPYGNYYTVERAEGNVIHAIDGVTALEFYERFYGAFIEDRELSFFPLALYGGEGEDFVLRDSVAVNREDGSISFVGRIEWPCRARITQVTREETLSSGHRALERLLPTFSGPGPELVMVFSCTSRRHVLGSRTDEELAVLRRGGQGVPFFGFYCYGEIGPFPGGGPVHFHSDTCITVALRSTSGGR